MPGRADESTTSSQPSDGGLACAPSRGAGSVDRAYRAYLEWQATRPSASLGQSVPWTDMMHAGKLLRVKGIEDATLRALAPKAQASRRSPQRGSYRRMKAPPKPTLE